MTKKRLYKSRKNKMIGGVCGGLAEYLNVDPAIVRICAGLLCLIKGLGFVIYLIACIAMPYNDEDFSESDENLKSANINPESEKKSSAKKYEQNDSASDGNERIHNDDDFDTFFKK